MGINKEFDFRLLCISRSYHNQCIAVIPSLPNHNPLHFRSQIIFCLAWNLLHISCPEVQHWIHQIVEQHHRWPQSLDYYSGWTKPDRTAVILLGTWILNVFWSDVGALIKQNIFQVQTWGMKEVEIYSAGCTEERQGCLKLVIEEDMESIRLHPGVNQTSTE